jgi:hypothetical protein
MRMRTVLTVLAVLALSATLIAQQDIMPKWKSKDLQFSTDVLVAGVLLKPGDYYVSHVMDGGKHFLVFKDFTKQKELVRAECAMKMLEKKAETTRVGYENNAQGVRVLKELTFKGDKMLHQL